jgi:hypothetical protein
MKTQADADPSEIRIPHLPYSALCLLPRDTTAWFLMLLATLKKTNSFCPAKQRRALLESNPPRDNWIERRRNKTVSGFGEAQTSPKHNWRHLFQSLSMPHKTHPKHKLNSKRKTTLTGTRFFEANAPSNYENSSQYDQIRPNTTKYDHKKNLLAAHFSPGQFDGSIRTLLRGLPAGSSKHPYSTLGAWPLTALLSE